MSVSSTPVGVVDYGVGNLRSIGNALRSVGAEVRWIRDGDEARGHDRIVFPGVGAFSAAMEQLDARGLRAPLLEHVEAGRPLLGVCVGYQVLFDEGTEGGVQPGLGLIPGRVVRFDTELHVPHVGWNVLTPTRDHALLEGLPPSAHVYFVHSYLASDVPTDAVLATSEYDGTFVCAVARDNVAGTQFHPEKSGPDGLRMLDQFLRWSP